MEIQPTSMSWRQIIFCQVTSQISQIYSIVIEKVIKGEFEPIVRAVGIGDGAMTIAPYHNFEDKVPEDVKETVNQIMEGYSCW